VRCLLGSDQLEQGAGGALGACERGRRPSLGDLPGSGPVEEAATDTTVGATVVPAAAALGRFLTSCRARGLSAATLDWYERRLGAFLRGRSELPLEPTTIEGFLGALAVADATRHGYFRALRCFYRWLAGREGLGNPMNGLRPPRLRRRPPLVLSLAEVRRVMAAAMTRRDKALLALLLDTGIRLGEVHTLTWAAIGEETIVVDGKTGQREVPMTPWVKWVMLGEELPWRGVKGELTLNGVYQAVRRCLRRAGVRTGGPHLLRHTFARQYVLNGGDVFSLQRIMGHRDLSTTRIYVDMDVADLVAQHRRFSPIVRLLEEAAG
jgi:site-specific recombinase XerD